MPVTSDAKRALALLERVQQRVSTNEGGNGVASQVTTDLDLLTSLLQNPVLRNILKLEDSLEELNQHLVHHPSLLPSDFDIDKAGTLVVNQNILHTHRSGSTKTKEGKSSPALSNTSSSKQSTLSPETKKKDVVKTGAAFQQSILQAAAKREIIAIQLNKPEGQSLGFSVVGLRSDHKGDLGIFVQEIQPTGIAGRDGRLAEGDQILAIDGQVLEAAISHQAAIGILQRARGVVDLVVARGLNPEVPHIPLISLPQPQQQPPAQFAQQQQQQQLSPDSNSTRSRSSLSSQQSAAASSRSASPLQPIAATTTVELAATTTTTQVDVVQILTSTTLVAPSLGRSPSALSDGSKTGGDMVLNTEWAQVEVVDLINDGSGLGFGIIGGRSTGVVVKTIVPGGVSDRDGRLQSGDHILQIGEVSLRGMGSEQVAAVLRQSGTQVRLVVARPIEPTSPDYQGMSSSAPIVPTKVLGDPEELERHLAMHQNGGFQASELFAAVANESDANAAMPSAEAFDARFIFTPPTLELQQSDVQLHVTPSVPRSEAVIQFSGSHLSASTTDDAFDPNAVAAATALSVGQTMDLATDINLDYLPEVENFDVQLKKDSQGLGITIAGYVCEREELSGIFVKSINPGSVADLSGRIQINDQIVEVDGQSLRGFNNHQAVEVLRSTGQVVKLTLARYLRGPKYDQLQQAMAESTVATTTPAVVAGVSTAAVPSYRPPTPPPPSPPAVPRSPPPALPIVFQEPVSPTKPDATLLAFSSQQQQQQQQQRADSIDASPRLPQVPEPEFDQLMDLDRFDPLASPNNALDYSSLSPEELDKLIDHVYSAKLSPQCEAAIIAKWRPMVDEDVDIVVAQLSKFQPSGGLGISLEGTVDVEEGREVRPHHYIRSILPEGSVGANGILHSGDELLEVNGRKLLGLSHVEVVSILKDLPQSVRMVCARRQSHLLPTQLPSRPIDATQDRAAFASRNILGGSLQSLIPPGDRLVKAKSDGSLASTSVSPAADSPLSKSHRSRSLEPLSGLATWSSEPQVIELIKGDRGLGFSILDYQDPMNPSETIIVIRSLVPGGVAQQDGRLIPGDRLLFVNDINLENASLDEAVQVLKGAPRGVVQIGVAKPHPVSLNEGASNGSGSGSAEMQPRQEMEVNRSCSSSQSSESEDDGPSDEYLYHVQTKVPPPLPQTEPPPLLDMDTDSSESEMPNPLLVPVATERLLGSTSTGLSTDHASVEAPLPPALERTVRIKKGGDPLGINVEVVDGGGSGVLVTSVAKGGAVHRDGRIRTGDFLVSVNHETMRCATNAQARAILRRTQLVSTDVSIVYIPAGDAAIYRQTTLMTQLAQDMDSNASSVVKPSSSSSTTMTSSVPVASPKVTTGSVTSSDDTTETPAIDWSTTSGNERASESVGIVSSEEVEHIEPEQVLQVDLADHLQPDTAVSSSSTTTIIQIDNRSPSPKPGTAVAGTANGSNTSGMTAILSRHWGPERSVQILRDPTKSLGISIVGGKVDVASGSGAPITGIFIKNVLPDSPAGRTGQLRTGDRILAVDGEDLREASHERAVEVIRKAGNPVTFLVQSLVDWEQDQNGPSSLAPSSASRYQTDGAITPTTEAEHLTPLPSLITNGDMGMTDTIELPKVAPPVIQPSTTPMPEVIQSGVAPKPTAKRQETEDDSEEEDGIDLQGRTTTSAGMEIDRGSAGFTKLNSAEKAADTEEPDDFGYTQKKIHKRWGDLKGDIVRVDLDRAGPGGASLSTTSLGLSLAGHKDRSVMAVFICGLNPNGIAFKDGRLQVGDELVEVNGNVLHGRCHLNASAIIKSIGGARVTIIALRREGALQEVAVPPITRFPITLEEQPPEERYARFKNLRIITLKKGSQGLGIMIIEGRHADVGSGIFISDIQPESVAEQAGLHVGDMILCVNKDELLGADYDTAASVLKKAEGILTIVVSNPKAAAAASAPADGSKKEEAKPRAAKVPDEPLPDPATCEVKPGKETTIEVNKDKLGLGLSIVGGSDTLLGAILIHEVYPDGAAARDKRLKPGDQILEVNGESFRNITHSRALAVLRQTPAKVKMMVYRDETSLKDDDMLDIIEVELLKKPGRGLGLSIVGRRNGPGVYISDVVKGGAAEADGRLMQGDQILTVNGNDLRTASQEQAAAILKTAMGKIDLKVGRLKAGAASPRSATSAESSPAPSHLLPPAPPVREDSLPPLLLNHSAASSTNDLPLVPTPTTPPPPPPPPPPVPMMPVPSSLLQLDQVVTGAPTSCPSTLTRIVLERGADGLGFSIVGGVGNPQGDLPIFVKTVFERGAAAQSKLRPGDQIHAVDSTLLEGKTHQEAVALLKNAKGTVTLTIVS